ncbi:hypothetical protein ABK040_000703 [Willaertia magna]
MIGKKLLLNNKKCMINLFNKHCLNNNLNQFNVFNNQQQIRHFVVLDSNNGKQQQQQQEKKQNVVVLGSGWAGFRVVKDLDLTKYNLYLVTKRNHFLFTPLLTGAASGTVELRSIIEPVRKARKDESYHFYEGKATSLDTEKKIVYCKSNYDTDPDFQLNYDKLIIAIGCDTNDFGIPGVAEYTLPLKEIHDARRIRNKIISLFERAANPATPVHMRETLLHFVVVGAGATGVEYSAELNDLIRDLSRSFPPEIMDEVRLTVIEAGQTVLSAFDESLQKYTQKVFRRNRIRIKTSMGVAKVINENKLILRDGSEMECGAIIWSAGIKPRHIDIVNDGQQQVNWPIHKNQKIIVDDHLRVKGFKDIFALGDISFIENIPLAATAQVAQQQGKYVARKLNGIILDDQPFIYHHQGQLAYIGNYRAISQVGALHAGGVLSWVFWRSAYLTKLVSIRNKIGVMFDWAKTFIFGRDISRF